MFEVPSSPVGDGDAVVMELDRQPHVACVEQRVEARPFRVTEQPIVRHVDEVGRPRLGRVLHDVCRLRVERRGAARRVAHVDPLRVVEGGALRTEQHERVRIPSREVRGDDVVCAIRVPEEGHAFEHRGMRRDQAPGGEVVGGKPRDADVLVVHGTDEVRLAVLGVLEQRHVQGLEIVRPHAMHVLERPRRRVRLRDASIPVVVVVGVEVKPHHILPRDAVVQHLRPLDDERAFVVVLFDAVLCEDHPLELPRPGDSIGAVASDAVVCQVSRFLRLPVPVPAAVGGRLQHPGPVRLDAIAVGV
mmetsp:Transcript_128219/g.251154  ORF Transcript_128219/g.251154 Transcript_128219/m.251154 type:complete len:303 (-) Transcript_128219:193-1101(-)